MSVDYNRAIHDNHRPDIAKFLAAMDESYKKALNCFDQVGVFAVDPQEKIRAQARRAVFLLESKTATVEQKTQARETLEKCIHEGDGDSYACWFVINDELAKTQTVTDELRLKMNQLRRLPGGKRGLLYLYGEYKDDANTAFVSKLEETLASMEVPTCAYQQGLKFREMGRECTIDTERNEYWQKAKQYFLFATRLDYYLDDDDGISDHSPRIISVTRNNDAFQEFLNLVLYERFFNSSEISLESFDDWRCSTYKIYREQVKPDSLPISFFQSIGTELILGNHLVGFLTGLAMLPKHFRKLEKMNYKGLELSDTQWEFLSFLSNCVPRSIAWPQPKEIFAELAKVPSIFFCEVAKQIAGDLDSPEYPEDHLSRKTREELNDLFNLLFEGPKKDDCIRCNRFAMASIPGRVINVLLYSHVFKASDDTIIHKLWKLLANDFASCNQHTGEPKFFIRHARAKPNGSFGFPHIALTAEGKTYFDQLKLLTRKFAGGIDVTEDADNLRRQYFAEGAPRPK